MAMEWERMVLGRRAGQTAEFSTIMLVSGSGRQKRGTGLAGYPLPHPTLARGPRPFYGGSRRAGFRTESPTPTGFCRASASPWPPDRSTLTSPALRGVRVGVGGGKGTSRTTCTWFLPAVPFPLGIWLDWGCLGQERFPRQASEWTLRLPGGRGGRRRHLRSSRCGLLPEFRPPQAPWSESAPGHS